MKFLGYTVALVVLFIMGYALQSSITPLLVKENPFFINLTRQVEVNGTKMEVNLKKMSADEKPTSLTLRDPIKMKSEDGSMIRSYEKGQAVDFISLNDRGQLEVADPADAKFTSHIAADKTDIFEEVGKLKMAAAKAKEAAVQAEIARMDQVKKDKAARATDPDNGMANDGGKISESDNSVAQNDSKVEGTMSEPEGTIQPDPANDTPLAPGKIVDVMKESIKGGAVKEFTFEQVEEWIAGEEETVDGVSYQTGLVSYKAETIFGVQAVQAKALIQGGQVKKWVYAKTGMQIR